MFIISLAFSLEVRYNKGEMISRKTILTQKQLDTLDFIKDFIGRVGAAPTINELRNGLKLQSLRSVTQRLEALERKGFIKRDRFKQRNIVVLEDMDPYSPAGTMRIPVIASAGADAMQVYAQQQYDEYVSVDKEMIDSRKEIVAIKAVGNSMVDAGIKNGDYVLVEVGSNVENGDRVAAIVGDMALIKRIQFTPDAVILNPESKNGHYQPIIMKDDSCVFGKVLRTIKIWRDDGELTYTPIKGSEE